MVDAGAGNWVSDEQGMMSPSGRVDEVNGIAQDLFDRYGIETAVVTLQDVEGVETGVRAQPPSTLPLWSHCSCDEPSVHHNNSFAQEHDIVRDVQELHGFFTDLFNLWCGSSSVLFASGLHRRS